jgi:hypothetical protein
MSASFSGNRPKSELALSGEIQKDVRAGNIQFVRCRLIRRGLLMESARETEKTSAVLECGIVRSSYWGRLRSTSTTEIRIMVLIHIR